MAKFEDPIQENLDFEPELEDQEEELQQEEELVEETPQEEIQAQQSVDDDVPDKYRGKSMQEIIKMHQEAEKFIGKQAQEVGEHRKFFDDYVRRELLQKQAKQQPNEDIVEDVNESYFKNPEKAMNDYISNHPSVKKAEEAALIMRAQSVTQKLKQSFPNFEEVVQNPEFKQWVEASPVRQRLYIDADGGYDYDSAAELLSTWNIVSGAKKQQQQSNIVTEAQQNRAKSLKAATVDTGAPATGSKKRYSRQALRDLLTNNPSKYYEYADEILAAYDEGRVY